MTVISWLRAPPPYMTDVSIKWMGWMRSPPYWTIPSSSTACFQSQFSEANS